MYKWESLSQTREFSRKRNSLLCKTMLILYKLFSVYLRSMKGCDKHKQMKEWRYICSAKNSNIYNNSKVTLCNNYIILKYFIYPILYV